MLPEFTHFVFTTIDTHLSLLEKKKKSLKQNTHFTKTNTGPITGLKCDLLFNLSFCGKI